MTRLLFLFILTLAAVAVPTSRAEAGPACEALFGDASGHVRLDDQKVKAAIHSLSDRFLADESPVQKLLLLRAKSVFDSVASAMVRGHGNAYPFRYVTDGSVLKLRVWMKTGSPEIASEIEKLIKRYKDYPMSQRLNVERTAYVRSEAKKLQEFLDLPDSDFPVTFDAELDGSGVTDTMVFNSKSDVLRRLSGMRRSEPNRFNGLTMKFSRGIFLRSRDREQAHLERVLRIMVIELRKFAHAGHDPLLREKFLNEAIEALKNESLLANGWSRLYESRHAMDDEIAYFTGHRDLGGEASGAAGQLWADERDDLGVSLERMNFFTRLYRGVLVKSPAWAMGLLGLAYLPSLTEEAKIIFARESYLEHIAELPQAQYEAKSYELLKDHYGAKLAGTDLVIPAEAQKTVDHLRNLRAAYLRELKKTGMTQEKFARKIETNLAESQVSGEEFKSLMMMPEEKFLTSAKKIAAKQKSEIASTDILQRLIEARKNYDLAQASQAGDDSKRGLRKDALIDAFSIFLLGTSQDAQTQ